MILIEQSTGQFCKSVVSRCGLIGVFLIFQGMIYNGQLSRSAIQKQPDLLKEVFRCGFIFQKEVVLARHNDKACASDARSNLARALNRYHCVLPYMHHQCRHLYLFQQIGDVDIAHSVPVTNSAFGGGGHALYLIEPIGLLVRAAWHEHGGKNLPEYRIVLAPADADHCAECGKGLSSRIHHTLQIADPGIKRDIRHIPVRHAVAARIVAGRHVLVPTNFTLRELRGMIQVAMGWEGIHLHDFMMRRHNEVDRPRLYHAQLELDGTLMLGRDNVCWLFEIAAVH
jgi:Plasmid pRiA4b ORF-3-like protein